MQQRSSVIAAIGSANLITTKNGNKELELAAIDKCKECSEKPDRIDRSAGSRRGHQQWNRVNRRWKACSKEDQARTSPQRAIANMCKNLLLIWMTWREDMHRG
jgi:hypothetical protein